MRNDNSLCCCANINFGRRCAEKEEKTRIPEIGESRRLLRCSTFEVAFLQDSFAGVDTHHERREEQEEEEVEERAHADQSCK